MLTETSEVLSEEGFSGEKQPRAIGLERDENRGINDWKTETVSKVCRLLVGLSS